jgi:hypothetical protein
MSKKKSPARRHRDAEETREMLARLDAPFPVLVTDPGAVYRSMRYQQQPRRRSPPLWYPLSPHICAGISLGLQR